MFTKFVHGENEKDTVAVESIYNLLKDMKQLPEGTDIPFNKDHLIIMCNLLKKYLLKESTVLKIQPRVHILGDLHGQYNYLWHFTKTTEPTDQFLFLGNYCGKGKNSLEVLTLTFCMKLLQPYQVFLLRGSAETPEICEKSGFKEECLRRFDEEVYNKFLEVFECLPLAAIISNETLVDDEEMKKKILCLNGGIVPGFKNVGQLNTIQRPLKIPVDGFVHQMLLANPSTNVDDFKNGDNGVFLFGSNAVHHFLKENNLDYLIRSHQLEQKGFEYPLGDKDKSIITIYSAPNSSIEHNAGAHLFLREDMVYSITQVEPSVTNV